MGKDFKKAAEAAQPVYGSIIGAAQEQKEPDEQAALAAQEAQSTRGRKGVKMPRINMAFTPSNLDFIRVMAAIRGQTMTQFVNALVERERTTRGEEYERAKQLVDNSDLYGEVIRLCQRMKLLRRGRWSGTRNNSMQHSPK